MKWYCTVCGYVYEGPEAPEACPVCKAPKEKFKQMDEEASFATVHEVGVAQGVSEDILKDLRANFEGECSEVGMYLAMARVADREGYPEVSAAFTKYAFEEAEHAAKFAELLGVTKGMISAYETSVRMPSYKVLIRIARLFGVSTDYLLGLECKEGMDTSGLNARQKQLVAELVNELRRTK